MGSTSLRSRASVTRRRRRSTSGIAPFAFGAAGTQLAAHELRGPLERAQLRLDVAAEASARLLGRERAAALRVAEEQRLERLLATFEEHLGQAARRHDAERVAVAARVLDGDQPLLAGEARRAERAAARAAAQRAPSSYSPTRRSPRRRSRSWSSSASRGTRQSSRLHLLERVGVEQLPQLLLAEQLAQEVAVERERLRAPLGGGRVVLVHVVRDVVEEQRARKRRRGRRLDLDEVELARLEAVQDPRQRREVEDVLQALAVRLEDDRERRVAPSHLEERLRLQPLLPERRAAARDGGAG